MVAGELSLGAATKRQKDTGRNEWVGPVGKGTLEPYAHDKPVMQRLWAVSEQAVGFEWGL